MPVTEAALNSGVEPAGERLLPIAAVVVYPDATLRQATLSGDDSTQFAAISQLVGAPVVAVISMTRTVQPRSDGSTTAASVTIA